MDPTHFKKIQAMNRYKRRQFLDNLYFYSLTALTCSLFCCVTLCMPYLSSLFSVFFSSLIPFLLSSNLLFIIGNLIIFVLIVNSRILSSTPSSNTDVYYDEHNQSRHTKKPRIPTPEFHKAKRLEKHVIENVDMVGEDGQNILESKDKKWGKKAADAWPDKEEESVDIGDEVSLVSSSSDELSKRADDFIARVNRQRRLELSLLQYGSY